MTIKNYIRDIQYFPKKRILFKDITPLLNDPNRRGECLVLLLNSLNRQKIDKVIRTERHGSFFRMLLAGWLDAGFVTCTQT
ncbi:hypothetical protein [Flavobacterium calami]|uniref:hypothetical protein n=1 Tax=Flavobacterium calami TaxID=3139144 RepID=UPI003C6FBA70